MDDSAPVKIMREVPLPWLIGVVAWLVFQGAVLWYGQQAQNQALKDLSAEIKELRASSKSDDLKIVEHDLRLTDHERRIQVLEQRRFR